MQYRAGIFMQRQSATARCAKSRHTPCFSWKVSQEKLAELAGVHRTYESSVERGERNICLENMVRLGAALGVPLSRVIETMEKELSRGPR